MEAMAEPLALKDRDALRDRVLLVLGCVLPFAHDGLLPSDLKRTFARFPQQVAWLAGEYPRRARETEHLMSGSLSLDLEMDVLLFFRREHVRRQVVIVDALHDDDRHALLFIV